MTDSCIKLFRLKCFRKLSATPSSSSTNGLAGCKRESCGRCGSCECRGNSANDNRPLATTTLIDNGKRAAADDDDECGEPLKTTRRHLFRSISETTSTSVVTSESDDSENDELEDVLCPLVDEEVGVTTLQKIRNKNVREFPQMRSRTEVNLLEKLFRKKFNQKVNCEKSSQ